MPGTWQYYFSAETLESHMIPRVTERNRVWGECPGGFSLSVLLTVQKQLGIRCPGPLGAAGTCQALRAGGIFSGKGSHHPQEAVCLWLCGWPSSPYSLRTFVSIFIKDLGQKGASLMAQTVKNLPTLRETQVPSLGREDPLQKGMATHSSVLAWRIPWAEEPGGLQSIGSQQVRHNWATNTFTGTETLSDPLKAFS